MEQELNPNHEPNINFSHSLVPSSLLSKPIPISLKPTQHQSSPPPLSTPRRFPNQGANIDLNLSLGPSSLPSELVPTSPKPTQHQSPPPSLASPEQHQLPPPPSRTPVRTQSPTPPQITVPRSRKRSHNPNVDQVIDPHFPWSTNRPCEVHLLEHLVYQGITKIHGEPKCKQCGTQTTVEHEFVPRFINVVRIFMANEMNDRAPDEWINPVLTDCGHCGQSNCMQPVGLPGGKKDEINWLFLMLGQTLGLCNLEELMYFCNKLGKHHTGAKDRVLYTTYLMLCKQLDPDGPFYMED